MKDDKFIPWAIYDDRGRICFLDLAKRESDVWQIYLGWPNQEAIAVAKTKGYRAKRVSVVPVKEW